MQHCTDETGTATTTVPELVGLPAAEAHDKALDAGLLAVGRNATHTGAGRGPVADQEPPAGQERRRGSEVGIWIEGGVARTGAGSDTDEGPDGPGGGSGVPTQPRPSGPAGGGITNG